MLQDLNVPISADVLCAEHCSSAHNETKIFWRLTWYFYDRESWIDYIIITNLMHWLLFLFIKYYSPLHVSSLKCSSSGGYSCTHRAYGTVTLYESSWWPVGTQLEWELTVGGRLLVGVLRHPPTTFTPHSQFSLKLCTYKPPGTLLEIDSNICCMCTTVSSWRWALEARNI